VSYPLGRLVAAPDPAAAILYDFNDRDADAERWIEAQGFTLGVPTLEGDPDAVGVTYGYRQPGLSHKIKGSKQDALAALSALSRQLLRQSTGWLMVQLDNATKPGWLRIYRSGFEALSLERVYVDVKDGDPVALPDTWQIPLSFVADPFVYGERITLALETVTSTLFAAENPMQVVLPPIKGDAPTAVRVKVTPQAISGGADKWLLGVAAGALSLSAPAIDIGYGDVFTAGDGTAAGVVDVVYPGSSYREVTIDAGTPNLLTRLEGAMPDHPDVGQYKALLWCEAEPVNSTTRQTYSIRLGQTLNAEFSTSYTVYGDTVTVETPFQPSSTTALDFVGWVDLGEISLPFGNAGFALDGGESYAAPRLDLQIGTRDGTAGTVRIAALKLVPVGGPWVDATTLMKTTIDAPNAGPSVPRRDFFDGRLATTWDGDDERAWQVVLASGNLTDFSPALAGGFPVADPAAPTNLLVVFPLERGRNNGDSPLQNDSTWGVEASYHPLFLHFGDGS
jgi:hypothetical protein